MTELPAPYYSDDEVQLYLGDMREILPALGLQADLVLADPRGRRAIGIEADERYAEAAVRRLSQATFFDAA